MFLVSDKIILDYGKSMYGGWYANYINTVSGKHTGDHKDTLKELCKALGTDRITLLRNVTRRDN